MVKWKPVIFILNTSSVALINFDFDLQIHNIEYSIRSFNSSHKGRILTRKLGYYINMWKVQRHTKQDSNI